MNKINLSFTAVTFWILIIFVMISGNPFPYSDEWAFVQNDIDDEKIIGQEFLSILLFVFEQHVDHTIPILKIYYMAILETFNFDFRVVQFTNCIFLFLGCWFILRLISVSRGQVEFGDIAVPIIMFCLGIYNTIWGFTVFQFFSSVMLLFGFVFSAKHIKPSSPNYAAMLPASFLFLMSLCGMNGVIPSVFISACMLISICTSSSKQRPNRVAIISMTLVFLFATTMLIIWRSSSAASSIVFIMHNIDEICKIYFALLSPNPMVRFGNELDVAYSFFNVLLIISAIVVLIRRLMQKFTIVYAAFLYAILASIFLLLSISIGRAEVFSVEISPHYGFLALPSIVMSWYVLSLFVSRRLVIIVGLLFVCFNVPYYIANMSWRFSWSEQRNHEIYIVRESIMSGMTSTDLARKHIGFFNFRPSNQAILMVGNGLSALRKRGVFPYNNLAH